MNKLIPSIFGNNIFTSFLNGFINFPPSTFVNNLPKPIRSTIFNFDQILFEVKISHFHSDLVFPHVITVILHIFTKIMVIM